MTVSLSGIQGRRSLWLFVKPSRPRPRMCLQALTAFETCFGSPESGVISASIAACIVVQDEFAKVEIAVSCLTTTRILREMLWAHEQSSALDPTR
jgi:hypothetical protein